MITVDFDYGGNCKWAKKADSIGNSYFYHKDHLGSSSVMTDYPAGTTVEATECLPFGHSRDHTGTDVADNKFTDQEKDTETGLYILFAINMFRFKRGNCLSVLEIVKKELE